ncbi:hypothetical protein PFNF54_00603, partial [Plasmodium falciparum NF54]
MVRTGGSGGGGVDKDGIDHQSAKHLLDSIGKKVHDQVKNGADGTGASGDAKNYIDDLKGDLQKAPNINPKLIGTDDPCKLVEDYYNNHVNGDGKGERYPCTELSGKKFQNPFSDTLGGQCTNSKMRSGCEGACAPYRRLHLCHHNLESIETTSKTASDTLLLEVCMAAKYEGQSINTHYTKHEHSNKDSPSQLCTVLARSFADIGDIVRGKDLFYGNTYESARREKLENKLKEVFGKIHGGLSEEAKKKYQDGDGNYYQLREDWWTANRETVWKAITCEVKSGNNYFRATCGDEKNPSLTSKQCRCDKDKAGKPIKGSGNVNIVPTYFDYVPQYLRWFEEWAEDFCRLRKHKLKDAIKKCRGKNGEEKYCDLNRYDCKNTASGKHVFFEDFDCKDCQYSCAPFVDWIDNQKLEFLKQRKKYTKEITSGGSCGGSGRKKRDATTTNYEEYEKKFYKELKGTKYKVVNNFLEKLNDEDVCTKNNDIKDGGNIDFKNVHSGSAKKGDGNNKTFYRTKYCEACPWCGAEKVEGGWKAKEENCSQTKDYDPDKTTTIEILTGDTRKSDMVQKYKKFCNGNGGNGEKSATPNATSREKGKKGDQMEKWICYYDENKEKKYGSDAINFCVLQDGKQHRKEQKVTSYNAFFWKWVHDMLHDSVEWRERLNSCINNAKSQNCKNNEKCNKECGCFEKWVKQKKEKEWEAIKDHFGKQKDIIEQTGCDAGVTLAAVLKLEFLNEDTEEKSEKGLDAEEAKEIKHLRQMLEQAGVRDLAAVGGPCTEGGVAEQNTIMDKFLDEELKEAEQCKNCPKPKAQQEGPGGARSADSPPAGTEDHPDAEDDDDEDDDDDDDEDEEEEEEEEDPQCKTVNDILSTDDRTKQVGDCHEKNYGKNGPDWKCGDLTLVDDTKVCMPPRRQKLCLYYIAHESETKNIETQDDLRDAFIRTAAAETFLSWQYYKIKNGADAKQLDNGTIPEEFLRSMYFTYGDYRDICLNTDISKTVNDVAKAKDKIGKFFSKDGSKSPSGTTTPQDWWQTYGKDIWKGMICALTHGVTNTEKKTKIKNDYSYDKVNQSQNGNPSLEDFAKKPQFLRWMIEWGEEFCAERGKLEQNIGKSCNGINPIQYCSDNRHPCNKACDEYKNYVETKQKEFRGQTTKFVRDANLENADQEYKDYKTTQGPSKQGNDYLKDKCDNKKCSCMEGNVLTDVSSKKPFGIYAHKYSEKCNCLGAKFVPTNVPPAPPPQPPPPPAIPAPATTPGVNPCEIVNTLFSDTNKFKDACTLKYGPKAPTSWKCIPTGNTSNEGAATDSEGSDAKSRHKRDLAPSSGSNQGSICVPPRRRKLYVTPLTKWAEETTKGSKSQESGKAEGTSESSGSEASSPGGTSSQGEKSPQGLSTPASTSSPSNSRDDDLLKAFVESAAVETFFLWHKYKMDKQKELDEKKKQQRESGLVGALDGNSGNVDDEDKDPQKKLEKGDIPEEFKRQMFYTLGDYRDILVRGGNTSDSGNTNGSNNNNIVIEASGDKQDEMKKIQKAIDEHINSLKQAASVPNPQRPGQQQQNSSLTRETLWKEHAPSIWEGMICSSDGGAKDGVGVNGGVLQRARRGTPGEKTATSSDSGAICVPPRRRRLYVTPLTRLAGGDKDTQASVSPQVVGETPQVSTPALTSPPPSDPRADVDLVKAFVESAAVETFFLWDRYKKEWEHRNKKPQDGLLLFGESTASDHMAALSHTGGPQQQPGSVSDDPQSKLQKSGEIPTDFLRQMFYTLGDYRDICIGGDRDIVGDTIVSNTEGGTPTKISEKIEQILSKQSGTHPPTPPGPPQTSVEKTTRESWWNAHAPSIWKGMICALTYKENDEKKIVKDNEVYEKFFGTTPGTTSGKYKEKYEYNTVKLDENSDTEAKDTKATAPSDNTPTFLSHFVLRPPYFRYLEEWGEKFCKERKKKLKQIKVECKVDSADYKCSGYGEECKIEDISNIGVFADLKCPGCGRECRKYKKWIERKKIEFGEQKSAYVKQKTKCKEESGGGGNGVCGTVKTCDTAAQFLERLGPCKNNDNGEGKIEFNEQSETFKHTKHCDPCSSFKIDCRNGKCKSGDTKGKCDGITTIDAKEIAKMISSTPDVVMRVSDNDTNTFEGDDLKVCEGKGIFKGIRKEEWKCRNECGLDVCGLKKGDNNGKLDDKQIILIRALIKRWLEYFLEDYNKIKHKISDCINNGEGNICKRDCQNKCNCVGEWIKLKKEEWEKIKKHYLEKNKEGDNDMKSSVRNFLEKFEHRPEFNKAIKPCKGLTQFESFCGLNGDKPSQNGHQDAIDCMIKKLEDKITSCLSSTSGEQTETECQEHTPLPDDEDLLLEETENPVGKQQPSFCPKVEEKKETVDEGKCGEDTSEPKKTEDEESKKKKDESTPDSPEPPPPATPEAPKEEKKVEPQPQPQPTTPQIVDKTPALVTSTLAWSVGIGFAAFTYFFLK